MKVTEARRVMEGGGGKSGAEIVVSREAGETRAMRQEVYAVCKTERSHARGVDKTRRVYGWVGERSEPEWGGMGE